MTKNISSIAVLIVAAGAGTRFYGDQPKQYSSLLGKPVLRWSIDTFARQQDIGQIFIAFHPDHRLLFEKATEGIHITPITAGGATRQETVRLALAAIKKIAKPDYILVHDAARPVLSDRLITDLCKTVRLENTAVIPALPVVDTLRRIFVDQESKSESRDNLFMVQTPQAFPFAALSELHEKHQGTAFTDDAGLFEKEGIKLAVITGERSNIKITHPQDMAAAEQYLSQQAQETRTGQGYDVHRLVPAKEDRKLVLGGIEIAHDYALEGHSDADVLLHAITDALLATIGAGDIGMHFSPKDPRWKNADSAKFLRHAADLVGQKNGLITHIDATLVCEEPKIGPYRERIRARIGEILSLPVERISLKATTTEGLGFTGRREGIAAQAIATVRLPFMYEQQQTVSEIIQHKEAV